MKGTPVGSPPRKAPGNGQPQEQVIEITRQITYTHVALNVVQDESGVRSLTAIDPGSQTIHIFPLDDAACRALAGKLVGGLTIPAGVPKPGD